MQESAELQLNNLRGRGSPVAVGGVGGSGTRVVADVLRAFGLYMGSELNAASDNLWFTLLFRRPMWYQAHRADLAIEAAKAISIFDMAMRGSRGFGEQDYRFVLGALDEVANIHNSYVRPLQWAASLIGAAMTPGHAGREWGWKEPNTHIYLEQLNGYYDNIKYIHVIRHGLDMAFSRNQFQLLTWGPLFGLPGSGPVDLLPKVALEYWIMANKRAIAFGQQVMCDRFLLLRFEDLCDLPEEGVQQLATFLGRPVSQSAITSLSAAIHKPETAMRYKNRNLSIFDEYQLAAVEEMGFTI